jgi:hypothetical protein
VSSIFISAPLAALWKEHEPDQQKVAHRLARKQARAAAVDSDIVDVEALRRAELAMATEAPRGPSTDIFGQPTEVAPIEPNVPTDETDTDGDVPEDGGDGPDDGGSPTTTGSSGPKAPKPDRQRRHQNVQR